MMTVGNMIMEENQEREKYDKENEKETEMGLWVKLNSNYIERQW